MVKLTQSQETNLVVFYLWKDNSRVNGATFGSLVTLGLIAFGGVAHQAGSPTTGRVAMLTPKGKAEAERLLETQLKGTEFQRRV
jgi:hypothetical protein